MQPAKDVCIQIHIGPNGWSIFTELSAWVRAVTNVSYDVYISAVDLSATQKETARTQLFGLDHQVSIITVENRGMDIGGWMMSMQEALRSGNTYKYLLKLHTKRDNTWRRALTMPLLCPHDRLGQHVAWMDANPTVGMKTAWLIESTHVLAKNTNGELIREYETRFHTTCPADTPMAVGSIFLCRYHIWPLLFDTVPIDILYPELPLGYVFDGFTGQRPHTWERLFSRFVAHFGYKVVNISGEPPKKQTLPWL